MSNKAALFRNKKLLVVHSLTDGLFVLLASLLLLYVDRFFVLWVGLIVFKSFIFYVDSSEFVTCF